MAYVSRDPYAREELHRQREAGAECAWCDAVDRDSPNGRRAKVYRYRVETEGGRTFEDRKTFCSLSCRKAYGG